MKLIRNTPCAPFDITKTSRHELQKMNSISHIILKSKLANPVTQHWIK